MLRYSARDFDYDLPPDRIASHPTRERTASRLLHVPRASSPPFGELTFRDLPRLVREGDVVVLNDTRVMKARFVGTKPTGARSEVLLLRPLHSATEDAAETLGREWRALVRPGSKLGPGRRVRVSDDLVIEIVATLDNGVRHVRLCGPLTAEEAMASHGQVPIPPYLARAPEPSDADRYQTVYAQAPGSVAAPTAGLHFDQPLLSAIRSCGANITTVTLHVGVGTFRPVDHDDLALHVMHHEWYDVPSGTARAVAETRARGGRVWAVGTTVARTLEASADGTGGVCQGSGSTNLFIRPPYSFKAVDVLLTNFHLPRSTLLMLVSAFGGYETVREAYAQAIRDGFRFYSYGDAMVLT